ncbi:filament-like plant protein 4 [Glycine soja]|nr:filament-like plant protein 4 [Glycine soja]RZB70192.1 Filament-like plant protein 4 isoform A [Glycine soja]RZB70193.1 Filament-like plant protein 4 isoform B [Glycine soja]RZB70197.1 Filament-like plant protein 4 isoform F [Glycine soja]
MDRRWPWKKKSSDKTVLEKAAGELDSAAGAGTQKPSYVQISVESYSHLTGLEDQVKTYEEKVQTLEEEIKELNEKLSAANSEINTKESLVKQHAKVAEEAVSGWEKAEAEALALKNHLETVTLAKLTAEDQASQLDGALKECMRQIRKLKEEHEQKIQEVALIKTKQLDKIKGEFEAKIENFEQELLRSAADNAALSRSLQERSNMIINLSEEKAHAEAEIELLKGNIESCEREINSLKYELHVISKELEIRNEEKNMSMRSAEAANKQHMEGVKKIAKLEAECQRLRGLVRKKLPGPAALAQMKLEVESLGREYGETRLRKSPVKPSSSHMSTLPGFSLDNAQKFHKDNEFLTERLLAMEEETKMLKEALAKRNSELQASRSSFAKTLSKLQILEAQVQTSNQQKGSPQSIIHINHESIYSQNASNAPSFISLSEDGNDDVGSCAESWSTAIISELSQFPKEKNTEELSKSDATKKLELMDDFLEVEKLARLSNDFSGVSVTSNNMANETVTNDVSEFSTEKDVPSNTQDNSEPYPLPSEVSSAEELSAPDPQSDVPAGLSLAELQSRISSVFESTAKGADIEKILKDIKHVLEEACCTSIQDSVSAIPHDVKPSDTTCDEQGNTEDAAGSNAEKEIISSQQPIEYVQMTSDLEVATSQIHDFVLSLAKEAMTAHDISSDGDGISEKMKEFSVTFNKVTCNEASLLQFVLDLSNVLAKASEFRFNILGYKGTEAETNSPDCIDKIALPENKLVQDNSSGERYQNGHSHILNPCSDPEVPDDGNLAPGYESNATSQKFSMEDFEELKLEKEKAVADLSKCAENLEMTKSRLLETEQYLAEVKSQLASAQRSNSLAETQLKCMTESYRTIEARTKDFETELNHLRMKTETLENELEDEKKAHEEALAKYKEIEEQLQRNESLAADKDIKTKQERNLAAAAEKLAECQETIFLLGKQLKSLHPQTEPMGSPYSKAEGFTECEPNSPTFQDQAEMDSASSAFVQRLGGESPLHFSNSLYSPSDNESNFPAISSVQNPNHRPTKSTSSSASSTPTPEKHTRGFSRFFSSKGKNGH